MSPLTVTAVRRAGASPPLDRSALVYGAYMPSVAADTVGVPAGSSLAPVSANAQLPTSTGNVTPSSSGFWNITTPNTIVEDKDIYGSVKFSATGCGIRRCRGRGRPSNAGAPAGAYLPIIDASSSAVGAGGFFIEDCTLWADSPGWQQYGVKGKAKVFVRRTHFGNLTDAAQMYEGGLDMRGCLIEALYRCPDPNQGDGWTHNDGVQYQGLGGALTVVGNHFDVVVDPWTNRSLVCLLVTADAGSPAGAVVVDKNWFEGGSIPINIPVVPASVVLTGNVVRKGQRDYGSGTFWHATVHPSVEATWTQTGNVDWASGTGPLLVTG